MIEPDEVRELAELLKKKQVEAFQRMRMGPSSYTIAFRGVDRPKVNDDSHFREMNKLLQTQPTPERTFMSVAEYILRSDDLAMLYMLARVAVIDRRILLIIEGLHDAILKYGTIRDDRRFAINIKEVYELAGPDEASRIENLFKAYNFLLWAVRTAPSFSELIRILVENMQYPSVTRQITEKSGRQLEASSIILGGLGGPPRRRRESEPSPEYEEGEE